MEVKVIKKRNKKHPHHVGNNIPKSRKRVIKGGLKVFRDK
jgi:hypothetical protein